MGLVEFGVGVVGGSKEMALRALIYFIKMTWN
jgi:hypothetical protein